MISSSGSFGAPLTAKAGGLAAGGVFVLAGVGFGFGFGFGVGFFAGTTFFVGAGFGAAFTCRAPASLIAVAR